MTRRRIAMLCVVLVVAVLATTGWWYHARTRPGALESRFGEALIARHPGATVERSDADFLRASLRSGVYIDVQLASVFQACRARPLDCTKALDRALKDVDDADRATREPRRAMVRAAVIGESSPGFRFGYITEPLIGPLEIRYTLVSGVASTFVTAAIADRLGLTRLALREVALTALRSEQGVDLERVEGSPALYRVRSPGDAAASLLDRDRMKKFAARIDTTRLQVVVPARGSLYLAAAGRSEGEALVAQLARLRGSGARVANTGLLAYDADANDGAALSTTRTP